MNAQVIGWGSGWSRKAALRRAEHSRSTGHGILPIMRGEFTAIIEQVPEGGYWAMCPEVPGANVQGETVEETRAAMTENWP